MLTRDPRERADEAHRLSQYLAYRDIEEGFEDLQVRGVRVVHVPRSWFRGWRRALRYYDPAKPDAAPLARAKEVIRLAHLGVSHRGIAEQLGLHRTYVCRIIKGTRWKHLTRPWLGVA